MKKVKIAKERAAREKVQTPALEERASKFASLLASSNRGKRSKHDISESALHASLMEKLSMRMRPEVGGLPETYCDKSSPSTDLASCAVYRSVNYIYSFL